MLLAGAKCLGQPRSATSSSALFTTLNGYSLDQANVMVNAKIANAGAYTKISRSNIWFSKAIISDIDNMLDQEKAELSKYTNSPTDGLRIYFARDGNGYNIILVATRSQGVDANGKPIHQDYFRHNASFLVSADAKGYVDHGSAGSGALAYSDLYPSYSCNTKDNCSVTGDKDHYINCADAINWINNYGTDANDSIGEGSEWFDLTLIDYLNNELKQQSNSDGLRIYLARDSSNSHRFILVTTITDSNGNQRVDNYNCLASSHQEQIKTQKNRNQLFYQQYKQLLKNLPPNPYDPNDNGEECPTNCSGITWP